ncbi:MAG: glycine/sarcosine/betaine reductase complex component C subunit beta [Dehalococcoidia bacterium]|nr:glycine/sarcosine/betaine reductase complex component C subunit beta [Dehalococcoidia bacterium]
MDHPVIRGVRFFMAHTPGLVRHGSKPDREIARDPEVWESIKSHLRSFDDVVGYAPHQVLLGNRTPESLAELDQPWYENVAREAPRNGPHGELVSEEEFYGLLKAGDDFDLLWLDEEFAERSRELLVKHPRVPAADLEKIVGVPPSQIEEMLDDSEKGAKPLQLRDGSTIGLIQHGLLEDPSLAPDILLENLAVKATGTMALRLVMDDFSIAPDQLQYIIGSGEEAIGDRYNRGGGNLAKTVAEAAGCIEATGSDVKAFCCAPVHAMVVAGSLATSGVFPEIAVIGGCSLAKLGMKFGGHLAKDIPVMEDILVGFAVLMGPDDGVSPRLRLDSIGRHTVGAGSVQQAIIEALVQKPLENMGLSFTDIDKYSTEMHNPEITDTAGSGNVPRTNYRLIAAIAAARGDIPAGNDARDEFVAMHGMMGFSPTQGHVASAVPYLAHALDSLRSGESKYTMFLAKGSLFLGRMTHLSDGESFVLEANPAAR